MNKIKMGARQFLIPKPVILVGTVIEGKPNFITVSWTCITSEDPPTISVAVRKIRYSLKGISGNMTFSVNIPSADQVKETDYCGTVSGKDFNKVKECNFNVFYGSTKNAPLIEQCPVNLECEVSRIIDLGDHSVIIGEIIESYISGECCTGGLPDLRKINPLCYCALNGESSGYYRVGEHVNEI